jgi:hypothetical protein
MPKKYFPLIVILLAGTVNLPNGYAQSASIDSHQAGSLASSDRNVSHDQGIPEVQCTRLPQDSLPILSAREGNILLAENLSLDSIDHPPFIVSGFCHLTWVQNNLKTAKGGEWILDGRCFGYGRGCLPRYYQDYAQCPPGALALRAGPEICNSQHAEVDLDRKCQE